MYLEDFPNNYSARGAVYRRKDGFVYDVVPNHKNGEVDARVLLSWDIKEKKWVAYIEGMYMDGAEMRSFFTGPFRPSHQATEKLCGYFRVSHPPIRKTDFINLISMSSPNQLQKMANIEKFFLNNMN